MWKEKKKTEVIIETHQYRIVGTVHLDHQDRLLDMLNMDSQHFIAITTASIFSREDGKLLYNSNFLGLNKDHIVSMAESESSD